MVAEMHVQLSSSALFEYKVGFMPCQKAHVRRKLNEAIEKRKVN